MVAELIEQAPLEKVETILKTPSIKEDPPAKKPYTRPRLHVYGSVKEFTRGGAGTLPEQVVPMKTSRP